MARRRPFEDAPPAVSSSEDEEETDDEEETPKSAVQAQHNGTGEKQNDNENGSEEEEDDDDDDDDEEEKEKPNLPPSKPSKPDSESDSETGSEDTESTQPPSPSLSEFTIKQRSSDEEMSGEGEEVNMTVKKQRRFVNDEMNGGGMELSVSKRNAVANEELDKEEAGSEDLWDKYPYLRSSLDGENLSGDVKERTMLMLGMAEEEKLAELEREWRSLMKAKLEFIVMQKDLIAKQIKLSLDAMNSHGS